MKRMRIADAAQAGAWASELRSIVKEWCALGNAATARAKKSKTKAGIRAR